MKTCQHCGYENPRHRELCLQCGQLIEIPSRFSQIAYGFIWILGGIVLIIADSHFDLLFIPFALSIVGVGVIFYGIGTIFPRKEFTATNYQPPDKNDE
jgi:hypothetical protein